MLTGLRVYGLRDNTQEELRTDRPVNGRGGRYIIRNIMGRDSSLAIRDFA